MPPLISDTNFQSLRKDPDHLFQRTGTWPSMVGLDMNGFTDLGTVVPGILNVAHMLGTARFAGLPAPNSGGDDLSDRFRPTSAADIIVTVLYQRSPNLLRRFLECGGDAQGFVYSHHFVGEGEGKGDKRAFVIMRNGEDVFAGFQLGRSYIAGASLPVWDTFVRYKIHRWGAWHQYAVESWTWSEEAPAAEGTVDERLGLGVLRKGAKKEERLSNEQEGVRVLMPALTSRRWIEQPGFKIESVHATMSLGCMARSNPKSPEGAKGTGSGDVTMKD